MDAISLAATHTYEQVAELLWHSQAGSSHSWQAPEATEAGIAAQQALLADALPIEKLQAAVALMAPADPLRYDVTAAAVLRVAPGLITGMAACLSSSAQTAHSPSGEQLRPLAASLSAQLSARPPSAA